MEANYIEIERLYHVVHNFLKKSYTFRFIDLNFQNEWVEFMLDPSHFEYKVDVSYPTTMNEWWLEDDTLELHLIFNGECKNNITLSNWLHFMKYIYIKNLNKIEYLEEDDNEFMPDYLEIHQD